jgi:hypothetical protein
MVLAGRHGAVPVFTKGCDAMRRIAPAFALVLAAFVVEAASAQQPGRLASGLSATSQQEQSARTLERRNAVRARKAQTRAYKADLAAAAARERRGYELKMAPIVAKAQSEAADRMVELDRNRAEYLKAQAQFQQAEAMRRQAAAMQYQNWLDSQRRYRYP